MDLNADLGEGFPWDSPLLDRVTSASVCCGLHAGDPATIRLTLAAARERNVVVGAHPGYADREGFGRREMVLNHEQVETLVREQVVALGAIARELDVTIRFLKPHGALYNQARRDAEIARGILDAATAMRLPVLGQPGGVLHQMAMDRGAEFVAEGFADRGYDAQGNLLPRDQPGAILHDLADIAAQILHLAGQEVQTLCLHGDDPRCVELGDLARSTLLQHGVPVQSFLPCP